MIRANLVCLRKRRYTDECQARAAGMESLEKYPGEKKLWVYSCPHCSGWHLTKHHQGKRFEVTI